MLHEGIRQGIVENWSRIMITGVLKGIEVSKAINERISEGLKDLKRKPKLAIVRVGNRQDDLAYERAAVKKMEKLEMDAQVFEFMENITDEEFAAEFERINTDDNIDGILVFKPLPKHLDSKRIDNMIDPDKDLDGISLANMAKLYAGDADAFAPCTAQAVIEALKYAGVELEGKNVTVIGRSLVIGKPVSMLLIKNNATVTVCHTRTKNIEEKCSGADILIAAAGKAKMVNEKFVRDGQIVMDVGINVDENGNMCGDVDFEAVEKKCALITPVPGGIGSITTSVLAEHLLKAAIKRR